MQLTIFQQIILGIIQGITEWLPISSSGFVTLINSNFFGITDIGFLLHSALFLHLGTFLAALIYFRKDILQLTRSLFKYKYQDETTKKTLKFLIIATIISGIIGLIVLQTLMSFESQLQLTGKTITAFVGGLLLLTGIIQIKSKNIGLKKERQIKNSDSLFLGFVQGLASIPGISRSGITISTLLLRKFEDTTALRLSFLMSLPIVFLGNIILNFQDFTKIATITSIYGLLASFVFGLLTISGLMKLSKKINFGWFILIFALIMLASVFVIGSS
ncbi:MAG: undecaprenyl-diphosphate phosphatase [archaeon]